MQHKQRPKSIWPKLAWALVVWMVAVMLDTTGGYAVAQRTNGALKGQVVVYKRSLLRRTRRCQPVHS